MVRFEWIKLPITLLGLFTLLSISHWLWHWDQRFYDVHLGLWSQPVPQDIAIVAIDQASLARLGRWPWSRNNHAKLIDKLSQAGAKVIMLDIIFAEPSASDSDADQALVDAIANSGRVVLPLLVEQSRLAGTLVETPPLPIFANVSAGIGHVHVELDPDGFARRVYLREGLGTAHWPHVSLEILRLTQPILLDYLPGTTQPSPELFSPFVLVRNYQGLIPFIGPPGYFPRISYAQVLQDDNAAQLLKDKIVFVGATATGLGDSLPTPVSGLARAMPGVEINANIFSALRDQRIIETFSSLWRYMISVVIILLPALLLPKSTPNMAIITTLVLLLSTLVLVIALLRVFHLWLPPAAMLMTLASSYPLWSWWRLRSTLGFINTELELLYEEKNTLTWSSPSLSNQAIDFLQHLLPIKGWVLYDPQRQSSLHWGDIQLLELPKHHAYWLQEKQQIWLFYETSTGCWQFGINWLQWQAPDTNQRSILEQLFSELRQTDLPSNTNRVENFQARIHEVQQLAAQIRTTRTYINQSLKQMADGVIVVSLFGEIELANKSAALYLCNNQEQDLMGLFILDLLIALPRVNTEDWQNNLCNTLLNKTMVTQQVFTQYQVELLIHLSPLLSQDNQIKGAIFNLSNITPLKESERKRAEMIDFLSHDLRSPLVSLLALIEMAQQPSRTSEQNINLLLNKMQNYTHTTLSLAENFAQLSQLESGYIANFQTIDLISIVHNALDHAWAQATQKDMKIEHHFSHSSIDIMADPALLERVFINLISNAIKYSPAGNSVKIDICLDEQHSQVNCYIIDDGYGIATHDVPKLFNKFQRLHKKEHHDIPGLGLGLCFVKAAVEQHKGQISLNSQLGKGTQVCVTLNTTNVV